MGGDAGILGCGPMGAAAMVGRYWPGAIEMGGRLLLGGIEDYYRHDRGVRRNRPI